MIITSSLYFAKKTRTSRDEYVAANGTGQQYEQWRIAYDSWLTAALT